MKQKSSALRRYSLFLILFAANLILLFTAPEIGQSAFRLTAANLTEMLSILPPIFLLLGLMDVWIPRETMMKYMGRDAGLRGGLLAFTMGSAAAGPLYAAFPVSGMLLKKGVTLSNVFIFIGAWSTTKIPMLLFEASSLGWKFTAIRLLCSIAGILMISFLLEKTTSENERKRLYKRAQDL
ncbi:MAG: permease [Eubacteriales bacterium]|jgi:uncharacterized membrane protein YraQ (UPF0718 family)|nr:permease [Eubacteriales bacterium]MDD3864285.1 permease [Eubacteriales bacterium]